MKRGFAMVEVLISAAILIIGITSAAEVQAAMSRYSAAQRRFVTANEVAEQTLERLLILYGGSASLSEGAHDGPTYNIDGIPAADGMFSTSWNIELNTPIEHVRRVTVKVRWREYGRDRTVTLSTLRS
jgi:Tfp pilus assembly protein PilV